MNKTVIEFNQVGKKFKKGHQLLLKEALLDVFRRPKGDEFWAVKDLSLRINKGEVVGIIGANGSGKSTILKLIAGVMTPTKGKLTISGRVGPLIELGAGFHPELSGRDNIYLNGTVLGLTKKEVEEKFDQIVQFSEIGDFIDTPVKHYSSGMYMRLGFAIAIHVDPEILLIDEILAVGDTKFQKKCLQKVKELRELGKTIVLVSHSMEQVKENCQRAYLVADGKIIWSGSADQAIEKYSQQI